MGNKVETEQEFTLRLKNENPRGLKGLAYVLREIRRALAEGIIKPQNSGVASKSALKMAKLFNQ